MAITEVSIETSGIPAKVTGVKMQFRTNGISTCHVNMDPSNPVRDIDSIRRTSASVSVNVWDFNSHGGGAYGNKTIKFDGRIDGMSSSVQVGSSSYSLVLKANAQCLVESGLRVPGISGLGLNPYKRLATFGKNASDGGEAALSQLLMTKAQKIDTNNKIVPVFYLDILKASLETQLAPTTLAEVMSSKDYGVLSSILQTTNYKGNVQAALDFINSGGLDVSAIANMRSDITASTLNLGSGLIQQFLNYPDNVWGNIQAFFANLGCSLICGCNKVFVVPDNGFITSQRSFTNTAYDINTMAINYDDNGWKDVSAVAVIADPSVMASYDLGIGKNFLGSFPSAGGGGAAAGASAGAGSKGGGGMVVIEKHPFMFLTGAAANNPAASQEKTAGLKGARGHYTDKLKASDVYNGVSGEQKAKEEADKFFSESKTEMFNNYAESKYYQAKYQDRGGFIQFTEFRPHWVPGTTGSYVDSNGRVLTFLVQSVTHNISLSEGSNGTATTTVEFNCGREGGIGVASDNFFNYGAGNMENIQASFLSDIGA